MLLCNVINTIVVLYCVYTTFTCVSRLALVLPSTLFFLCRIRYCNAIVIVLCIYSVNYLMMLVAQQKKKHLICCHSLQRYVGKH